MRHTSPALLALLLAAPAAARVVSYAPVTDRIATPVQQSRTSPDFVLIEAKEGGYAGPVGGPVVDALPWYSWLAGRLVVHDATGGARRGSSSRRAAPKRPSSPRPPAPAPTARSGSSR